MKTWKRRMLAIAVALTPVAALAATVAVRGGCPVPCPFCP